MLNKNKSLIFIILVILNFFPAVSFAQEVCEIMFNSFKSDNKNIGKLNTLCIQEVKKIHTLNHITLANNNCNEILSEIKKIKDELETKNDPKTLDYANMYNAITQCQCSLLAQEIIIKNPSFEGK